MPTFQDKVFLITGGSSGIGRGAAVRLAAEGAKLAIAARSVEALQAVAVELRTAGAEAITVPTDVGDPEQCRRAVEETVARFGQLDGLICSAGVSMRTYFENSDLAAIEQVIRVNLLGTMYVTQYALPHVKRSRGSLVALGSLSGQRGIPSYSVYGASKFGVQGFYDSLRLELWRDGVHVGVVSPGFVATPLRDRVLGPGGTPWKMPPPPPFRVWTVDQCVDRIMTLLRRRRSRALLPGFVGPLLWLDQMVGRMVGDRILYWKFPPL